MKTIYSIFTVLLFTTHLSYGFTTTEASENEPYNRWLKNRFEEQHQKLIPIVAVADMFFACNQNSENAKQYGVDYLVQEMDKEVLAEKLQSCLGDSSLKSDEAINFGLSGCFHEQLASLPEEEKAQKMKLVKQAISSLSREERQKSLTQCVTDQAIKYLK